MSQVKHNDMRKTRVQWVEGNSRKMLVLLNQNINNETDHVTVKFTGATSQREFPFSPTCSQEKVRFTVPGTMPADEYIVEVKVERTMDNDQQILLSRKRFEVTIVKYDEDIAEGADVVLDAKAYIEGPITTFDDMTDAEKEELATRMGQLLNVDEDGWLYITETET